MSVGDGRLNSTLNPEVMQAGQSALGALRNLVDRAHTMGIGSLTGIAKDQALRDHIEKASGALSNQGREGQAHQAAAASLALAEVIVALKAHQKEYPSLRPIAQVLEAAKSNLSSDQFDPHYFEALSTKAHEAVKADLKKIEAWLSPDIVVNAASPLAQELVGTPNARQQHAEQIEKYRQSLESAFTQCEASDAALLERFNHISAAVFDLKSSAPLPYGDDYLGKLKDLLTLSLTMRDKGFVNKALDAIITESASALAAVHTGQGILVEPTKRKENFLDRIFGFSAKKAARALGDLLGDDPAMKEATQLLAKAFDIKLRSREELYPPRIGDLKTAALRELAKIEKLHQKDPNGDSASRHVHVYVAKLKENVWIKEAEQHGVRFVESFTTAALAIAKDPIAYKESIVKGMLNSYSFNADTGVSTFTAPAWVTDAQAAELIGTGKKGPPLISNEDKAWLERLPQEYPKLKLERDYSTERRIEIQAVVPTTIGRQRTVQVSMLQKVALGFADPRDQANAALLHFRTANGANLFDGLFVRGVVPGRAVGFDYTLQFNSLDFGHASRAFAASGSPVAKAT